MTEHDQRLLQQCINWIRSFKITGPFVTGRSSLQSGASYHVGARGREAPGRSSSGFTFKVDSARTGDAWYKAYIWLPPSGTANEAADGTEAAAGTQGDEITVLNLAEIEGNSSTGHDLTQTGNLALLYRGWFVGQVDSTGKRVAHTWGLFSGSCDSA